MIVDYELHDRCDCRHSESGLMIMTESNDADLRLRDFKVLSVVLRERSLTRAAEALDTTQPSVSKVLGCTPSDSFGRSAVRSQWPGHASNPKGSGDSGAASRSARRCGHAAQVHAVLRSAHLRPRIQAPDGRCWDGPLSSLVFEQNGQGGNQAHAASVAARFQAFRVEA